MNARERVRLALTGQPADRIPVALGFFSQSLHDIPDVDEHFDTDVRYAEFNPPEGQDDFMRYLRRLPREVHVGSQAQMRNYHDWDYHPELEGSSRLAGVRSVAELAEAAFPDLTDPRRYAGLAGQVAGWHARGLAVAGSPPHLGGELFETAWRLRGFEEFMIDLKQRPSMARYLVDQLAAMVAHNAVILAQAGVDVLILDDDVAMPSGLIISPTMWREVFGARLREIIRLAREAAPDLIIFYHSDGDFTRLIPDLVDIGVDVINPVQPDCMDALAIRREFGGRLAMWGAVGAARTWDRGTPGQIRAEVRQRRSELGPAGLLLAPAYDLDYTPLENITAFLDAAREEAAG